MKESRFFPSKKGMRRKDGWVSAWTKPKGRFWKRNSNKKVRRNDAVSNGGFFKKVWGWFEWS
jgi:hypothetical protein